MSKRTKIQIENITKTTEIEEAEICRIASPANNSSSYYSAGAPLSAGKNYENADVKI